ncbi:SDR family NAD(P)-dependent oxidoreductase [Brevundimonas bacteroides]|uniref:SDR family NAD(P)-dependent oxidoreductase n=1 Tax=Brevundimonas bacteroides TaxID=74311 RepID=UPI0004969826|nr:SDR family NAD(P)-dependent oxidoreductase [Brevundimonas bacteroides]
MSTLSDTPAEALRPLAVVTGASSGIGYELARRFSEDGYDLIIAADRPLAEARQGLEAVGGRVETVLVDLATQAGVQQLYQSLGGRPVDALVANAGEGVGGAFLDQDFSDVAHVIDTNVTGTLRLVHLIGRDMRERGRGRMLITGSIAGLIPGPFHAVYNASKAFVDNFAYALRNELKDTGVTVTVLMPGATETDFFERAGLTDTKLGTADKMSPVDVARIGYEAMNRGDGDVVAGMGNKVQAGLARVTPPAALAEVHRKMAEPGSGD